MLLQFSVSNYQSIRERQTLSLVATSLKDDGADLIEVPTLRERVLPAAVIYGANASGKTSVLKALELMVDHIKFSQTKISPGEKIPRRPFALDDSASAEPTEFECDFVSNGVRYHFGFKYLDEEFVEEWLYAVGSFGTQRWYERHGPDVKFGKYLKGKNRTISGLLRPNALFLSLAAQNAHVQLTEIFSFFTDKILFQLSASLDAAVLSMIYKEGVDRRIVQFLRAADAGIVDAEVETKPTDEKARNMLEEVIAVFRKHGEAEIDPDNISNVVKLSLGHASVDGSSKFLALQRESRGTLRLLELLRPTLAALDQGATLVIDELDSSLHTLLSFEIIKLFGNRKTNSAGGQLIATTHDTNLLRSGLLRRDQIWFTEKNSGGETCLYPLTEIATRKGDNLEKGYLQGRFGAIPFLGGIQGAVSDAEPC